MFGLVGWLLMRSCASYFFMGLAKVFGHRQITDNMWLIFPQIFQSLTP